MSNSLLDDYKLGLAIDLTDKDIIAEGKTKVLISVPDEEYFVDMLEKDIVTAGDGKKQDYAPGKGALVTTATCNVFRLLNKCGIPTAFHSQINENTFRAKKCKMLPYEVVVRRQAKGSYLKRAPHLEDGHCFPKLVLEFYLKTNNQKWSNYDLQCDDPLIKFYNDNGNREIRLFNPKTPDLEQIPAEPFLVLNEIDVFSHGEREIGYISEMGELARRIFLILEGAFRQFGRILYDFKVEFGLDRRGNLLLADELSGDSWRLSGGLDKQSYRDGGSVDDLVKKYVIAADVTSKFHIPSQQVVLWCGSESDDIEPFRSAINPDELLSMDVYINQIICSAHKKPVSTAEVLNIIAADGKDTVIIAYVGRSNGLGPTLSANTFSPVITVPAGYRDFPDDVWSSLRTPSKVPVMTVLEPANAMLAALNILAMKNPALYASMQYSREMLMG